MSVMHMCVSASTVIYPGCAMALPMMYDVCLYEFDHFFVVVVSFGHFLFVSLHYEIPPVVLVQTKVQSTNTILPALHIVVIAIRL